MDHSPRLSGEEWQIWGDRLLQRRYGPAEYQKVPDNQKGDAGIEGFTIAAGHAYQLYGPEEPLTTDERYMKHRTKMTDDLSKFVKNGDTLSALFGNVKISRWILLVPYFDSKEIVKHAANKTSEIIAKSLPYVDNQTFRVFVMDEDEFSVERDCLLNANLDIVSIVPDNVSECHLSKWTDEHDGLVQKLDDKILRIPTLNSDTTRLDFRNKIIRHYLQGQNALEELRKYPTAYENIRIAKGQREHYLQTEVMLATGSPNKTLQEALAKIDQTVRAEVPSVSQHTVTAIAWEAVSDWLIRCPLDFPTEERNDQT